MEPEELTERDKSLFYFYVVLDSLLHLSRVTGGKHYRHEQAAFAEGLVLKAGMQLLTIRNILGAGEWKSALDANTHYYLIDPLSIATVLRGAYECMLTLNHVFVNSSDEQEVELRYLLWVLETLNSKNQAEPSPLGEDKGAREEIRKNTNKIVYYLLELPIVRSLDAPSQKIIRDKALVLAGMGWEYYKDGTQLKPVKGGWKGLTKRMPARKDAFNNLYKLFSLNSHPTWHSVNIIVTGFEAKSDKSDPENLLLTDAFVSLSAMIGSFILYDYCTLFPEVRAAFSELPDHFKEAINSLLFTFKGDGYTL